MAIQTPLSCPLRDGVADDALNAAHGYAYLDRLSLLYRADEHLYDRVETALQMR